MAAALLAAFLIFLLQAGFGLVATGLCRAKNAAHTMAMHLLVVGVVAVAFFVFGFALLGDSPQTAKGGPWHFHHSRGYLLQADKSDVLSLTWFLLAAGYAAVAAVIPAGALAERWSLKSLAAFTFVVGAVMFPIFGCWIWTGGWLAQLGVKADLAHGAVDYAGSCVVHLQGGTLAFVLAWLVRPRLGKYDESGRPRPILGHDVPMVILGSLVLWFGWFGFTTGRSLLAGDGRAALIAVNTLLAGTGGALAAASYMWLVYGKPDPSLTCNGLLAGLVAICASCAFVAPWAAMFIGVIGGIIAVWGVLLCERRGLDDPVGASSVHGLAGLWGTVTVGLLADGSFGDGYNGVTGPVRGLLYRGGGKQLLCQLIAAAVCIVWAAAVGGILFALLDRITGGNRVPTQVELAGLDIPEMGAPGYPEFISHAAPEAFAAGVPKFPGGS